MCYVNLRKYYFNLFLVPLSPLSTLENSTVRHGAEVKNPIARLKVEQESSDNAENSDDDDEDNSDDSENEVNLAIWTTYNKEQNETKSLEKTKADLKRKHSAQMELLKIQMESARQEFLFKKEEHELKMAHLRNEEKRREELHALTISRINHSK